MKERSYKLSLRLALVGALLWAPVLEAKQQVQFAGVAFVGGKADAATTMPYVTQLLGGEEFQYASKKLASNITRIEREDLQFLVSGEGGVSVSSGGAIATALAISAETFRDNRTSIENTVKLSIRAQILTFDFTSKRIISAFPIYSATVKAYSDDIDMDALRRDLVLQTLIENAEDPGKSIFDKALERLRVLQFKSGWNVNLQVRNVAIKPPAAAILEANAIPTTAYKRWLAASFSAGVADVHGVPVLPYTQDQALNQMRLRFDEGDEINFSLPPVDFAVDLVARGFGTKVLASSAATVTKTHGVGMEVHFSDVAFNEKYFAENMQMGRVVQYNKNTQVSEWPIYEEVQLVLINELMAQLENPQKKWIDRHVKGKRRVKDVAKTMKSVNTDIIQKIRE
jgi:hypothetical protein